MVKSRKVKRNIVAVLLVLLLICPAVGGTVALLITQTEALTNIFSPGEIDCVIEEKFNGVTKEDVSVKNIGDASCYIRVKLLPYWYDKETDTIIAKTAWKPMFEPGEDWVLGSDGFWYYTKPVEPNKNTSELISKIDLEIDDITLSRQVLEIIASCIQAKPAEAVKQAWSGENGSVTNVSGNTLVIDQGGAG